MVRIIFIAVTILGLAAGFFGISARSTIKSVRADLEGIKSTVGAAEQRSKKAEEALKNAEKELADLKSAKSSLESEVASARSEASSIKNSLSAAEQKVREKEDQITALRNELATLKQQAEQPAQTADSAQDEKLRELQVKLEEQLQVTKALEKAKTDAEERITSLQSELDRIQKGLSRPGLEGKVLGVNPNWNFVLLSIGDRQGVAVNSTLLVKRGGSLIAKVRVTSIDRNTSVADIVPGSVARGTMVQPGDTVIFGG